MSAGDDAVADDAGRAVDVAQEVVEGPHPLLQASGKVAPVGGGNDPGDGVNGDDAFLGLGVAVNGEGNAFVGKGAVDPSLDGGQFVGGELAEGVKQGQSGRPGLARGEEHFVVDGRVKGVVVKVHGLRRPVGGWSRGVGAGRFLAGDGNKYSIRQIF